MTLGQNSKKGGVVGGEVTTQTSRMVAKRRIKIYDALDGLHAPTHYTTQPRTSLRPERTATIRSWQTLRHTLERSRLDEKRQASSSSTATRRWSLRPEASCSPAQVRRRTLRQGSLQARKRQRRTTRPNHQTGTIEGSRKWENLGSNQRQWPKTTSRGNLAGKGTRGNTQQAKKARQPRNGGASNHPTRFKLI